jgi:NitT/TauT family transport system permease protein
MGHAVVFVCIALIWEFGGKLVAPEMLPPLTSVLLRIVEALYEKTALSHIESTLWKTVLSFALGSVAGILLGLVAGWFRLVDSFLQPLIYSTYSLPRVALIPLFVLWLGLGDKTVVVVAAVAVFYIVLINTINGVKQIDPVLIRAARNLGANDLQLMTKVLLPAAAVPIFAAIRLGVGQALISVISGEILIGDSGLGYWIWNARYRMDTTLVFVNLVLLALLGYFITLIARAMEKVINRWQRNASEELWV